MMTPIKTVEDMSFDDGSVSTVAAGLPRVIRGAGHDCYNARGAIIDGCFVIEADLDLAHQSEVAT